MIRKRAVFVMDEKEDFAWTFTAINILVRGKGYLLKRLLVEIEFYAP